MGYIERDAFAAALLVARMEEQTMDVAPIWDDLTSFDSTAWRECVDILSAGIPCQPFSYAGKHSGTEDERWLWPDIHRINQDCRASQIFIENTPGLIQRGLYEILHDLAEMGYSAEWGLFNASDSQAPHKRQRVFLLAHREDIDIKPWSDRAKLYTQLREQGMGYSNGQHVEGSGSEYRLGEKEPEQDNEPHSTGCIMADTKCKRRVGGPESLKDGDRQSGHKGNENLEGAALWPTPIARDAGGSRRETVKKGSWKSKDGTTLTDASHLHAGMTTRGEDGLNQVYLNPQFVETLMGLPLGWTDFAPLETQSYHSV